MKRIFDQNFEISIPGLDIYHADFIASRNKEISEILSSLALGQFNIAISFAHQWKGFSTPYGFGMLADIAAELELEAQCSHVLECQILVKEAQDYLTSKI